MSGVLKKHAEDNHYTRTFDDFERRLEAGKLPVAALRSWDCYGARCPLCDESVTAFKYKGERYYLHNTAQLPDRPATWYIHQCRPPVEDVYPDDPNVRDGNGDIVAHFDWSDDQDRRHDQDYPDPPYGYPDIPYVDPTR